MNEFEYLLKKFNKMCLSDKVASIMEGVEYWTNGRNMVSYCVIVWDDPIIRRSPDMYVWYSFMKVRETRGRKSKWSDRLTIVESLIIEYWCDEMQSIYSTRESTLREILHEKYSPKWVTDEDQFFDFLFVFFFFCDSLERRLYWCMMLSSMGMRKVFLEPHFPLTIFRIHCIRHVYFYGIKMVRETFWEPFFPARTFLHDIPVTVDKPFESIKIILEWIAPIDNEDLVFLIFRLHTEVNSMAIVYSILCKCKRNQCEHHSKKDKDLSSCYFFSKNQYTIQRSDNGMCIGYRCSITYIWRMG